MASDGFEQDELFVPLELLRGEGCEIAVAAPSGGSIRGTVRDDPGRSIEADLTIGGVRAKEWDALLIPGGLINPDHLRARPEAVALVCAFADVGRPVGAICHGPWLLVEADLLRDRRATCWPSIRTDLRNAGALLEEGPVVTDGGIVTAVGPDDAAAFARALLAATGR
jgi:protease I